MIKTVAALASLGFMLPGGAPGQNQEIVAAQTTAAGSTMGVRYEGGMLQIDLTEVTLADVLKLVADRTGVALDLPVGVGGERMPTIRLGPGSARQILAKLLSDADCDYLIQGSEEEPGRIKNVLIMAADKSAVSAPVRASAATAIGLRERPEEAISLLNPTTEEPGKEAARAALPDVQAAFSEPRSKPTEEVAAKSATASLGVPPTVMNAENIAQQLQQMYQQRIQINQKERQTAAAH